MPRRKNPPNNKKRRVVRPGSLEPLVIDGWLHQAQYCGSPHHKSRAADYGFQPPVAPRPGKSLCDDLRSIKLREATRLFRTGIRRGMVSCRVTSDGLPAFVWSVDEHGQPYEAKPGGDGQTYHGYRLNEDDSTSEYIRQQWKLREETSDE